jgi:hypothetical protein
MNVQLSAELIPAFYQPPDYTLPGGHIIRRHDDVWSFMVLKTLMDIKGDIATVGEPIIWHRKEGDRLKEALAEHGSNLIQAYLYQTIREAAANIKPDTYANMAHAMGTGMIRANRAPGYFAGVIDDYAIRIRRWAALFI